MKNKLPLLCLLACTLFATASDLPPLEFPAGVGVNIHFTRGRERDLDMIAAAGFKFIRMDFGWAGIERKKGEYDWSAYDELTANLEKRGLRAIYIFDYSHPLYENAVTSRDPITGKERRDVASPKKPESVEAFARWSAAAAAHFKGKRIVWEIWNEPNISFWKPKPNAEDYSKLVLATCKAVRAADANATIVGPASSEFPWAFFEVMFKAGALEYLDAVSVHPYRSYGKGPETAAEEYLRLRAMIEKYAPAAKKSMPIVSGEWGYATQTKGGVTLETQAAFIARQQIANVWQGVPISIWYDWKNDGLDASYGEHNFGTVSNDLSLKPSYVAVQALTRELQGFRIVRRLETSTNEDFAFLLVNERGQQKIAAWTAGKAHSATLALGLNGASDVAAVNGQGKPLQLSVQNGELKLALEPAPQYITIKSDNAVLKAAASWSIDGYVPTLVEAGNNRLQVPVKVKNPFSTPKNVRLVLKSAGGSAERFVQTQSTLLEPGKAFTHTFSLKPSLRSAGPVAYEVQVDYQDRANTQRNESTSSEELHFLISNPLALSVAPIAAGLRVAVQNPSGSPFKGAAIVNGKKLPLTIEAQQSEAALITPASAAGSSTSVRLVDTAGALATDAVNCRIQPIPSTSFQSALDGDAKIPATATIVEAAAPTESAAPFSRAFRLDYSFGDGWRFVRAILKTDKPITFDGKPAALGLWVYGDKSGNALRTRVTDSGGQTFQPGGPNLDWTGWRWVEFDLIHLSKEGHWGGANDGVPHGNLRLDTLLLVDGSRKKTSGTVYFAGPAIVYK